MCLIRIGPTVLNLDRVTCIRDLSDRDVSGQVTRGLYRVEFDGSFVEITRDYEPLHAWLAANATTLATTP